MNSGNSKPPVFKSILIIDDDEIFINILKTLIQKKFPDLKISFCNPKNTELPTADSISKTSDLLILDYNLGDGLNGLDLLAKYISHEKFPPTILLTAEGNEDIAVKAIRKGAYDYINKQKLSIDRLLDAFKSASEHAQESKKALADKPVVLNKIDFYRKLESLLSDDKKSKYCLIQIGIDNYKNILEKYGVLTTDKFIHNLSNAYALLLNSKKIRPEISFLGESTIGVLITKPEKDTEARKIAEFIKKYDFTKSTQLNPEKISPEISIGITFLSLYNSLSSLLDASNELYVKAKKSTDKILLVSEIDKADKPAEKPKATEKQVNKETKAPAAKEKPADQKQEQPPLKKPEKISLDVFELVKNNRIQPYYHPCIALSDVASSFEYSLFNVAGKIIDINNKVYDVNKLGQEDISKGNKGMLDRWLIRDALGQSLNLVKDESKLNLGLFIGLSGSSLSDNDIHEWMENSLNKINHKNISSSLIFEINPLDLISNKKQVLDFVNDMRDKYNITFSINNIIKPDIVDLCVKMGGFEYISIVMDREKKELLKKIVDTGKDLGVLTLMYGIEDAESLNFAVSIGVDFGQGDFIQPAMDSIRIENEVIEI